MRGVARRSALSALLITLLGGVEAGAQPLRELFSRVERSVVKVSCPDLGQTATGFVWSDQGFVVTALHVVDGSRDIQVHYPSEGARRRATVVRVLKGSDLVLLRVDEAPDVPVLQHVLEVPDVDQEVHALGFHFGAVAINSYSFKLRYGGRRLRDNVSDAVVKRLLQNGYPSPDLEVLKLGQESLLPGLSGAPVFDASGRVVAIGDGGIEEGAINVSWAVPAHHLDALARSTETRLPGARGTAELFAAELKLDVGRSISAGGVELVKLRNRSLAELVASADDRLGLQQLSTLFVGFDPANFRYDIYQDLNSGATVVLPEGAVIQPGRSGKWTVRLGQTAFDRAAGRRRLEVRMQVNRTSSAMDAQGQWLRFEEEIGHQYHGVMWQVDPQWSYVMPLTRFDGLVVTRKAVVGYVSDGMSLIPDKYVFETLAAKGDLFVGIAAINRDNTPATGALEALCVQGHQRPECPRLFESRRQWAQLVLGIQLTSFSL